MKDIHRICLGQWPPSLYVTKDKQAYDRFLKHVCEKGSSPAPFPPPNGGLCQKFEDPDGSAMFVIAVGKQRSRSELIRTIAHEATHAMRWILEHASEEKPGVETEAYLVEHIVAQSLDALR